MNTRIRRQKFWGIQWGSTLALALFGWGAPFLKTNAIEYLSPRALALGGTTRSNPILTDAIYLNPSYVSFSPLYSMSGGYQTFESGRNYNVSVVDGRNEVFQAGVGFTRREQNAALTIGASKSFFQDYGVGLGSKILIDDASKKTTADFSLSQTYFVQTWWTASLIIDNLLQTQAGKDRNLYRTVAVGNRMQVEKFVTFYGDAQTSPSYHAESKTGFGIGAEIQMLADFVMRIGRQQRMEIPYLNTRGDAWGWGIGWIGPRISLDYTFHRPTRLDQGITLQSAHAFQTTIFF